MGLKLKSLQPTFWFNSGNTLQRDEIFSLVLLLVLRKFWFKSWTHVKQLGSLKPLMLIAKPTLVQSKPCKICCHSCVANSSFQWHTLNLQEPNQSWIPCNQVRWEWWFSMYIFHVTSEYHLKTWLNQLLLKHRKSHNLMTSLVATRSVQWSDFSFEELVI